jgi:hypothetical protein
MHHSGPGATIVGPKQRGQACLRLDYVSRADDQSQAERADDLAEIAEAVAEAHAAAPQSRRPHFGRVRPEQRIAAVAAVASL